MQLDQQHDRYLAIELQRAIKRREDAGRIDLGTHFLKALARITVRLNRAAPDMVAPALDPNEIELARRAFAYLTAWDAEFAASSPVTHERPGD